MTSFELQGRIETHVYLSRVVPKTIKPKRDLDIQLTGISVALGPAEGDVASTANILVLASTTNNGGPSCVLGAHVVGPRLKDVKGVVGSVKE